MNRPTCRCREMSKIHSFSMDNRIYTIWEAEWYLINLLVKREIIELVRPNYWSCHVFYTSIFDPADMKLNPTASLLCFGSTNNNFQSIIWSYHWPIYVSIYTIGPLNGDNKYIYIAKKRVDINIWTSNGKLGMYSLWKKHKKGWCKKGNMDWTTNLDKISKQLNKYCHPTCWGISQKRWIMTHYW
jgi:hypothetical protein